MWNQPYQRRGIRFFPHIIPIGFPLIFPIGFGLVIGLFHWLFPLIGLLLLIGLAFFIVKSITQGSSTAAWNSMKSKGGQWSQRFTSQGQQSPYYQPGANPYYQPSAGQEQPAQPYGQGYQPGQDPTCSPAAQPAEAEQPRAHYPGQMPPMQQQ